MHNAKSRNSNFMLYMQTKKWDPIYVQLTWETRGARQLRRNAILLVTSLPDKDQFVVVLIVSLM